MVWLSQNLLRYPLPLQEMTSAPLRMAELVLSNTILVPMVALHQYRVLIPPLQQLLHVPSIWHLRQPQVLALQCPR